MAQNRLIIQMGSGDPVHVRYKCIAANVEKATIRKIEYPINSNLKYEIIK